MKIIGITGNSGSGKTFVSEILKENGGFVINTDKIGHEILKNNIKCYKEIVCEFSDSILNENSEIDRKKLGKIVFYDEKKLQKLNEITHKYIIIEINSQIQNAINCKAYKFIVVDGAVLIEAKLSQMFDEFLLIECDYNKKIERIILRDEVDENFAIERIARQKDFSKMFSHFTEIIYNNEDKIELTKKIIKFLEKIQIN